MAEAKLEQGDTVDGFRLEEFLHRGGMAYLWRVSHAEHAEPLIMKVPILSAGEDPAAIVSFEMELMILPRLSGSHVPRVVAHGDFSRQPYLVMERIPGETLQARMRTLPVSYEETAAVSAKIATALHDIHRQHVTHLDLKPANIMFRPSGEAVLLDFGLASHDQLPDLMQEEFRLPYGTAPFMAPEQINRNRREHRSDIFALGVLMYVLSTGHYPFGERETLSAMQRRLWRDPVPPRRLKPDYPAWLQEVVLRCLEVDPAQRYPTGAQIAFDLTHHAQVKLTVRAQRDRQDAWSQVVRRRFGGGLAEAVSRPTIASSLASAPIVAVAIDLGPEARDVNEGLRTAAARILTTTPGARLACVNVLKMTSDGQLDEQGRNRHVHRMVELRQWVEPLRLDPGRVTVHVLEALDPAAALIEYADTNRVDHLLIGARQHSLRRRLLGSVSARVAAEAHCTVTVVRNRTD